MFATVDTCFGEIDISKFTKILGTKTLSGRFSLKDAKVRRMILESLVGGMRDRAAVLAEYYSKNPVQTFGHVMSCSAEAFESSKRLNPFDIAKLVRSVMRRARKIGFSRINADHSPVSWFLSNDTVPVELFKKEARRVYNVFLSKRKFKQEFDGQLVLDSVSELSGDLRFVNRIIQITYGNGYKDFMKTVDETTQHVTGLLDYRLGDNALSDRIYSFCGENYGLNYSDLIIDTIEKCYLKVVRDRYISSSTRSFS